MHMKKYSTATIASLTILLMLCKSCRTSDFDMFDRTYVENSDDRSELVSACATQARHSDMPCAAPSHSVQADAEAKKKRVTDIAVLSCIREGGELLHACSNCSSSESSCVLGGCIKGF